MTKVIGTCVACGKPIYDDDKLALSRDGNTDYACHERCTRKKKK
jgi:hypothetical protein